MSTAPKFSILLPTYNRADVLGYAIQSVLTQNITDFELLVVGDGCTDQTSEVVASFNDDRIQWFDLPKGPGFGYNNRNIALKQARGEFIGFMAHDDLLLPDHLELCLKAFSADDTELVYTRPLWVTREGQVTPASFNLEDSRVLEGFLARRFNVIPASAIVYRGNCHQKYGYWDESLVKNGDWDLFARIIAGGGGKNVRFIPEPTVLHFCAIWKSEEDKFESIITWLNFYHQNNTNLPAEVSVHIAEGDIEQRVFYELLSSDPLGYTARLRSAIVRILDMRIFELEVILHTSTIPRNDIQSMAEELRRLRGSASQ